jgi:hypothetical protein
LAGATAVIAFWLLFFTGIVDAGPEAGLLHEFEMAFPAADAAFAGTLIAAAIALFRGRQAGPFFLVAAGAMSLYLGILDLTFYGRQGMYYPISGAGLFELAVNGACVAGGAYALRRGWWLWREATRAAADDIVARDSAVPAGSPAAPERARRLEVA